MNKPRARAVRPLAGRLVSYVGSDRRPPGERGRADHYYVRLAVTATDAGRPVDMEVELTAKQVWHLVGALPTGIVAEVSGIDRHVLLRAAGVGERAIQNLLGDEYVPPVLPPGSKDVADLTDAELGEELSRLADRSLGGPMNMGWGDSERLGALKAEQDRRSR